MKVLSQERKCAGRQKSSPEVGRNRVVLDAEDMASNGRVAGRKGGEEGTRQKMVGSAHTHVLNPKSPQTSSMITER